MGAWVDVLNDYARAHSRAGVILVNYGPEGSARELVADELKARCSVIGELRPGAAQPIAAFRRAVDEWVTLHSARQNVVVLDVSASMRLRERQLADVLKRLGGEIGARELVGVDQEIVSRQDLSSVTDASVRAMTRGRGESFDAPLRELLTEFQELFLISDADGVQSLSNEYFAIREEDERDLGHGLQLLRVSNKPSLT